MDRYLSPQSLPPPPPGDNQHKPQRDGASVLDPFFSEDHTGAPYTLNMNLYLPDGAYLRMGLCQQARPPQHQNPAGVTHIKTESASSCFSPGLQVHGPAGSCGTPGHGGVAMETSAVNMTLTGLPDFTSVFNQAGGGHGGSLVPEVFVKQEVSSQFDHRDHRHDNRSSMFQLLSSGLDHHHGNGMEGQPQQIHTSSSTVHAPFHDLPVASSASQPSAKPPYRGLDPGAYGCPPPQTHPRFLQQQTPYLPPSPPSSEPGSPDRQKELLHAMSPPPSYAASIASKLAGGAPALVPGPDRKSVV